MKQLIVVSLFLLTACASNKVASPIPPWPAASADLQQPAPELTPLAPEKRNLSDLIENSNENYTQYYLLKDKYEAWQNWYNSQQKIWQGLQ